MGILLRLRHILLLLPLPFTGTPGSPPRGVMPWASQQPLRGQAPEGPSPGLSACTAAAPGATPSHAHCCRRCCWCHPLLRLLLPPLLVLLPPPTATTATAVYSLHWTPGRPHGVMPSAVNRRCRFRFSFRF